MLSITYSYAHNRIGMRTDLTVEQIERLNRGESPGADEKLDLVYAITKALVKQPGALDAGLYKRGVDAFGLPGFLALSGFVGFCASCIQAR
jgi:hypothetical protein